MNFSQPMDLIYKARVPWRVVLEVTNACQLNCIHCFHNNHVKKCDELSLEEISRLAKQLRELGTMQITITGGEATLRKDIIQILNIFLNEDMKVQLLTNGQIGEPVLSQIAQIQGKLSVEVSLYGTAQTNYTITQNSTAYANAIKTIEYLSYAGIDVSVNTVVMQQNFASLPELDLLTRKMNVTWNHSTYIFGDNDKTFRLNDTELLEYYRRFPYEASGIPRLKKIDKQNINYDYRCNAGYISVLIDPRGNVYPCVWVREYLGNIRERSFSDIWKRSDEIQKFRSREDFGCVECIKCAFYPVCKRCPADAYQECGAYDQCPTEWCRQMRIQSLAVGECDEE